MCSSGKAERHLPGKITREVMASSEKSLNKLVAQWGKLKESPNDLWLKHWEQATKMDKNVTAEGPIAVVYEEEDDDHEIDEDE